MITASPSQKIPHLFGCEPVSHVITYDVGVCVHNCFVLKKVCLLLSLVLYRPSIVRGVDQFEILVLSSYDITPKQNCTEEEAAKHAGRRSVSPLLPCLRENSIHFPLS